LAITATGLDADLISTGPDNLIWQIAQRVGATEPVELEIHNDIPIGKGLGSSAAAVTAGVVIGSLLAGHDWDRARILDEAARIEGHPDNVAPSVLGGLVSAAIDCDGTARAIAHKLHPSYRVAVVVPDFILPTEESRRVLPATYSRADTVFNVQRAALLISALTTGSDAAFPAALQDRMHQPYRAPLVPGLDRMLTIRTQGLLGCALSGAGPSVLVFYRKGWDQVLDLFTKAFADAGHRSAVLRPQVPDQGYSIIIHSGE
jgi:homoserine kinase